jgi:hypothetical protein
MMNLFKKETPKEAAMKAKRETKREVRVRSRSGIEKGTLQSAGARSTHGMETQRACCLSTGDI